MITKLIDKRNKSLFQFFSLTIGLCMLLFVSTSLRAQNSRYDRIGWVMFEKEHTYDLSENFKKELSEQLDKLFFQQFLKGVNLDDINFFLEVGRNGFILDELDGFVFATAYISTPSAQRLPLTICWKSSNSVALLELHKEEEQDNTVFLFCADFPISDIAKYIIPKKIILPTESELEFPIFGYLYSFPDMQMILYLDDLATEKNVEEIDSIVKKLFKANEVYTGVSKMGDNKIVIHFDYYLDAMSFTKNGAEEKITYLLNSVKSISKPCNNVRKVSIF